MKVLLVDDEKDICDFVIRFFKERNIEVSYTSSGNSALHAIKKNKPNIVLLEIELKDITGIEILKRMKKLSPNTKTVVVTRADNIEIMKEAKRLGVLAYLAKPILLSELMDIVLRNIGRERRFFNLNRAAKNV
jgi:DNA-binding NtrC family response regulator